MTSHEQQKQSVSLKFASEIGPQRPGPLPERLLEGDGSSLNADDREISFF